ncbi:unannotated protein [freshwater metagenome]|uniref:Unannotated protein n=1 Tax=freshwater metagenome TaxID=449393 RepID=A0A6J7VL68_9ZZZZ
MSAGMGTYDGDSVTDLKAKGSGSESGNMAPNLVTKSERHSPSEGLHECRRGKGHSDIAMAETVARDLDEDFSGSWGRNRGFCEFGRVFPLNDSVGLHCLRHGFILTW